MKSMLRLQVAGWREEMGKAEGEVVGRSAGPRSVEARSQQWPRTRNLVREPSFAGIERLGVEVHT